MTDEEFSPRRLGYLLYPSFPFLILPSFYWGGVDFGGGVSVGCGIVAFNYFLLCRVYGNIFSGKTPKAVWLFVYLLKLGVIFGVVYVSSRVFGLDVTGIFLGLSSIVITVFVYFLYQSIF